MHTILVIEDDHDTRVTLRKALEEEGYFVFSAANGADGLSMLQRIKPPCVIFLDLVMPLMNGEEFLKLKNRDQTLAPIPVVSITAGLTSLPIDGVRSVLRKPLSMETLIRAIQKIFSESNHCTAG